MTKRKTPKKGKQQSDKGIRFTYSTSEQPLIQRTVIRAIETMGGRQTLKKLYDEHQTNPRQGESFFDAATRLLRLNIQYDESALERCPRSGSLVFIANHPYGVLDGITLAWLSTKVRPDTKVLANSVLCQAPEAHHNLLPVDFADTRGARETNVRSRLAAQSWLRQGHAVGIFPAGGVSTS